MSSAAVTKSPKLIASSVQNISMATQASAAHHHHHHHHQQHQHHQHQHQHTQGVTRGTTRTSRSNSLRKGIQKTQFVHVPLSPRLHATRSPAGPCTPFLLDTGAVSDYLSATTGTISPIALPPRQHYGAAALDAAFAKHVAVGNGNGKAEPVSSKRSYSSVLSSKR